MSSTRPANHHRSVAAGEGTGQPRNRIFERHKAELDVWLEGGSSNHDRLRDFAVWAGARGITGSQLEVPWLGRADQPSEVLDDAQRWQLLKRCLHDDQIELPLRVAGALVLLYGQVPIRIVALTADHITMKGTSTYLTLDTQPVLVPPRLAGLLARLAAGEPAGRRPLVERHGDGSRLLFPGSHPGQPMDFDRLSAALNQKLGLRVRPARNAALCALAADLPAPVLAELLGLHISTAIRWGRLVRRDWTSYLAARKGQASHAP